MDQYIIMIVVVIGGFLLAAYTRWITDAKSEAAQRKIATREKP